MAADDQHLIVDDRAGFYMVPSAAITKARARLCGAQLTEALAGLACLARESFVRHGASRDEQQALEANLEDLAGRILGVSRARALRIVDNLTEAGALTKEAHRFDGTRRLPTKLTFVDLAHSFAYVSGPAFRALRPAEHGAPPLGPLALYLTLVALGGEQRAEFPDANRRTARASQPELAKLSGLSVSSVKRALAALTAAGLIGERPQPHNALKTTAVYHLIDPADGSQRTVNGAHVVRPHADRRTAHSPTDDSSQRDRPTGHSPTDDSPVSDRPTAHGATDEPVSEPARAHVKLSQRTPDPQNQPPSDPPMPAAGEGGEVRSSDVDALIAAFSAWTRHALGDRRAASLYDAVSWRRAASELLQDYDLDRLLGGVDRLRRDSLLADKATTLPAFARIAERAIARAAADHGLAQHRATVTTGRSGAPATGPSWATAQTVLRQAISAFGPAGEDRALVFLSDRDPHLAAFARHTGWRALTRCDEQMTDIKYAYLTYSTTPRPEAA